MSLLIDALYLVLPLSSLALAGPQESEAPATDAAALMDRVQAALGAPAARAAVLPLRLRGKASWVGLPGEGTLTEVYDGPLRARVTSEFKSFGKFEFGCDGAVVWELNPLETKVREGWHASESLRRFGAAQNLDWRAMYSSAKLLGSADVDGTACHEIELTPRPMVPSFQPTGGPAPVDLWYVETAGLRPRRVLTRAPGAAGKPTEVRVDTTDWREVAGTAWPHRREISISGFTMIVEYDSIEHGIQLPQGFFDLPASVVEAVAAQADASPEADPSAIELVELEEQHIASIRVTCKHADLQKTLTVIFPEAMQHVLSTGATMLSPPLVRYHSFGDTVDLEGAMQVAEPIEPKGRVKAETLPAGQAVSAWHIGPYDQLGQTHERVKAFMAEHDLEQRAAFWEQYWTDPGMEPDPAKWRTKIVWPVRPKQDDGAER